MLKSNVTINFKLSDKFIERFRGTQPNWGFGGLSYFTFKRTYAREKDDGTQEEFVDTLERVVNGTYRAQEKHCKLNGLTWNANKAQRSAQEMFMRMWEFKFLPPGRGLWMMGTSHVDKVGSAALNNCGFVSTKNLSVDLADPFAWAMDMLMLGVGIGFDTLGAGTSVYPWHYSADDFTEEEKAKYDSKELQEGLHEFSKCKVYVVPDTREGWVESIYLLIDSFSRKNSKPIYFDFRLIREAGLPIRGFGGTSSGPQPLIEAHDSIANILRSLNDQTVTSVAITDIMNFIGKCVVAGNVRRSAELAIGNIEDTDYVQMKDYDLYPVELNDRRWASNNSVFVKADSDFSNITNSILKNGEPGLIFLDNARAFGRFKDGFISEESRDYDHVEGFNPCAEQQLVSKELCCLVETFPSKHESVEDFHRTLKFAYLYAKSVTLIPTHCEATNNVIMRNRRTGTSQSGIQQAINKFDRHVYFNEFCDKGYKEIKKWDRIYSRWFGIPESIRTTTVKPSGTVSLLAGVWPGVHFTHSEYYFRTVRLAANSSYLTQVLKAGFRVEYSVTDAQKIADCLQTSLEEALLICKQPVVLDSELLTSFKALGGTVVIYFPVEELNFTKSKFEVTLWEQLATVREMQHYWSDNAVSCTITVRDTEKKDLLPAIEFFAPYVKTLSFLPLQNHKYEQAPYTESDKETILAYKNSLSELNLSTYQQISGSKFCDGDSCLI